MNHRYILTIGCLVLAGCAGPAGQWHRDGASDAQRDADYRSCRAEARDVGSTGVDQDIESSQGAESRTGRSSGDFDPRGAAVSKQALFACMTDQGYHPR